MGKKKVTRLHNITIEHLDRMCDEAKIEFNELIDRFALPVDLTDYFLNNHRVDVEQSNRITRHILAVKRKLYIERGLYRIEFRTNEEVSVYVRELIDTYGLNDISRHIGVTTKDLLDARDRIETMKEMRLDKLMQALTMTDMNTIAVTTTDELEEILGWLRKIYDESEDAVTTNKVYAIKMKLTEEELDDFVTNGVATRIVLKKIASFVENIRVEQLRQDMLGNALIVES